MTRPQTIQLELQLDLERTEVSDHESFATPEKAVDLVRTWLACAPCPRCSEAEPRTYLVKDIEGHLPYRLEVIHCCPNARKEFRILIDQLFGSDQGEARETPKTSCSFYGVAFDPMKTRTAQTDPGD